MISRPKDPKFGGSVNFSNPFTFNFLLKNKMLNYPMNHYLEAFQK